MATNAYDAYLESRVLSATPLELIQILYQAAIEAVESARRNLCQGDIAGRSKEISRACSMIAELATAVRHDAGPELARNLVELYDYLSRLLLDANMRQAGEPLAEASRLLSILLEGWLGLKTVNRPAPVAAQRPPVADELEYAGHSWSV